MGITVTQIDDSHVSVCGDIMELLEIPVDDPEGGTFDIGLSDGTLLRGAWGECGRDLTVEVEGAAIVSVRGDEVDVAWPIEWLTLSPSMRTARPGPPIVDHPAFAFMEPIL